MHIPENYLSPSTCAVMTAAVFTLAVEELILFVFITLLGMNAIVIKVIGQVVVTVLNYVVSKLFVFKEKKMTSELQS